MIQHHRPCVYGVNPYLPEMTAGWTRPSCLNRESGFAGRREQFSPAASEYALR